MLYEEEKRLSSNLKHLSWEEDSLLKQKSFFSSRSQRSNGLKNEKITLAISLSVSREGEIEIPSITFFLRMACSPLIRR